MTHDQMDISLRLAEIIIYSDFVETAEYMEPEKTIDKSKMALLLKEKDVLYDTLSVKSFDTQSLRFQVHKQWETIQQRIEKSANPSPELLVRKRILQQQEKLLLEAIEKAGGWQGALYLENGEPDVEIKLDVWPQNDQISMLQSIKDHLIVKLEHSKEKLFKAKKRVRNILGPEEQKMLKNLQVKVGELHDLAASKFRKFTNPQTSKVLDSSMDELEDRPTTASSGRPDSRPSSDGKPVNRRVSQNSIISDFSALSNESEIFNLIPAEKVGPILSYFTKILGSLFTVMTTVEEEIRSLDDSGYSRASSQSGLGASVILNQQAQELRKAVGPLQGKLQEAANQSSGKVPTDQLFSTNKSKSHQGSEAEIPQKDGRTKFCNGLASETGKKGGSEETLEATGSIHEEKKRQSEGNMIQEDKETQTDEALLEDIDQDSKATISQDKMNSIIGEMAGEIEKRDSEISRLREQEEEANQLKEIIAELGTKKEELEARLHKLDEEKQALESEKATLQLQKLNEGIRLQDIEKKLQSKPDLQSKHALTFLRKVKQQRIKNIDEKLKKIAVERADHFFKVAEAYKWAYHVPQVTFNGKSYASILEFAQVMKYGYKKKKQSHGSGGKRLGLKPRGRFNSRNQYQFSEMIVEPSASYGHRESVSHPAQTSGQSSGFVISRRSSFSHEGETMVSPIVVYKNDSDFNRPRLTPWGAYPQTKDAYVMSREGKSLSDAFENESVPVSLPKIEGRSRANSDADSLTSLTSHQSHFTHFSWSDAEAPSIPHKAKRHSGQGAIVKPKWKAKKSNKDNSASSAYLSGPTVENTKLSVSASDSQFPKAKKKINYRDLYHDGSQDIRKSLPGSLHIGQQAIQSSEHDQSLSGEQAYKRWKPRGLLERR